LEHKNEIQREIDGVCAVAVVPVIFHHVGFSGTLAQEFNAIHVYPIPELGWSVPESMAQCEMFGIGNCDFSISYLFHP
jgi:hypothetical protein